MVKADSADELRMKTRPRDIVWGLVTAAVIFALFVSALSLLRGGDPVKLLVGIVPGTLLAVGCWRRTKWGAPAGGLREWQEDRKTGRSDKQEP